MYTAMAMVMATIVTDIMNGRSATTATITLTGGKSAAGNRLIMF
jgi:hypothetical protein